MLSHLQGAANRTDLRRTAFLERELTDLQGKLAQLQAQHQQQQQQSDRLLAAQDKALQALQHQLQPARDQDRQLQQQLEESRRQCWLLSRRQAWALEQLKQRDRHAKPFVPLRSASLSAFTHRLRETSAASSAAGMPYAGGTLDAIPIRQVPTD